MFKETTAEDVMKVMRHDNKKLDDAMDELDALNADLRKVSELITNAVVRYRKEKLKKKSLKRRRTKMHSRSWMITRPGRTSGTATDTT